MGTVRIRRGFDEVGTGDPTSSFYLLPALSPHSCVSSSSVVVSHPLLPTAIATLPTGTRTTGRQMWTRKRQANFGGQTSGGEGGQDIDGEERFFLPTGQGCTCNG